MNDIRIPPENLKTARRKIEEIPNVKILNDWGWNAESSAWVLHCSLSIAEYIYSPYLPQVTNWYVLADSEYPLGSISFFPSRDNGLSHTFQHQLNNSKVAGDLPWKRGSICLDLNVKVLGRLFVESEPFSIEGRLAWYFHRALNWIQAASHGEFAKTGEPFELPDFSPNKKFTVAFSEDADSFSFWMNNDERVGTVSLLMIKNTNILATKAFLNRSGKQIQAPDWGKVVDSADNEYYKGLWIRVDNIPILDPWQPPSTFGELIELLKVQGLDFYEMIEPVTSEIRDGAKHFLLLGFPIPSKYGEAPIRIHWQAVLLPTLSSGTKTQRGFRPNQRGKFLRDKLEVVTPTTELDWVVSENWDKEQISARGRFPDSLSEKKMLIIGCGAVGSAIAELLVRGNASQIILVDGEELEVGNLVRHTLALHDIKKPKAQQLARRLNSVNPNSKINFSAVHFPPKSENEIETINHCDVIIDCTGDDKALLTISEFPWDKDKLVISVALNYGATRSFIFAYMGRRFPVQEYSLQIKPYLTNLDEVDDLPADGIGCWHPVFPARADDIWLQVSACMKEIVDLLEQPIGSGAYKFTAFEQVIENGNFVGVRKIR